MDRRLPAQQLQHLADLETLCVRRLRHIVNAITLVGDDRSRACIIPARPDAGEGNNHGILCLTGKIQLLSCMQDDTVSSLGVLVYPHTTPPNAVGIVHAGLDAPRHHVGTSFNPVHLLATGNALLFTPVIGVDNDLAHARLAHQPCCSETVDLLGRIVHQIIDLIIIPNGAPPAVDREVQIVSVNTGCLDLFDLRRSQYIHDTSIAERTSQKLVDHGLRDLGRQVICQIPTIRERWRDADQCRRNFKLR